MKKVLSIVLALLMMVPVAAMLVPTASAATAPADKSFQSNGGKVYYEENFDDVDPTLTDAELAKELGWTTPSSAASIWIEGGAVRIFSQCSAQKTQVFDANDWVSGKTWSSGYSTTWVNDPALRKNALVIEYTMTSNRRPAGEEYNEEVKLANGTTKTLYAQGQGAYQGFGALYLGSAAGSDNFLLRLNPADDGAKGSAFKVYDKGIYHQDRGPLYTKGGAMTSWHTTIDQGETYQVELYNDPLDPSSDKWGTFTGMYYNTEYKVKHVVDPHANRVATFINDTLFEIVSARNIGYQYTTNNWNELITEKLGFFAKPGADVTLDDIKVTEHVPALTISEIMSNGLATLNTDGTVAANATAKGAYQWIEITNPGGQAVNVYDYCVHLMNMASANQKVGDEVNTYQAGSGSTLGYFTPGAKTLANGEVFDSPAYADGVLQPGETAIVLFPQTAMAGGKSVTDEAFRAELVSLGMPEDTMLLVADNKSDYPFVLAYMDGQNCSVGIMKVYNTSSDSSVYAPEAIAKGADTDYVSAYAECTANITAKNGGGTNFYGMTLQEAENNGGWNKVNQDYANDGLMGHVPLTAILGSTAYKATGNKSHEISYSGWYKDSTSKHAGLGKAAPYSNIFWGWSTEMPTVQRAGIDGTMVDCTPGYVPEANRRQAYVNVAGFEGAQDMVVPTNTEFQLPTPKRAGYETEVWVEGVKANVVVDDVATTMTVGHNSDIEVKYTRDDSAPAYLGYQQSNVVDGKYTLRLLAGVNDLDQFEKLGFAIMIYDVANDTWLKDVCHKVKYVYESVTVKGENVAASDLYFDYLYALHIENVPADSELQISVKAIYDNDVNNYDFENNQEGFTIVEIAPIVE